MRREEDPLRALLHRQVEAARKDALETGGHISSARVARLARLARLVHIARATQEPAGGRRWWMAALVAGTLVVVSTLLFARVRETDIELDLELEEIGFVLSDRQVLTDVVGLAVLGASGLRQISLPDLAGTDVDAPPSAASAVRIAATSNGAATGEISLAPLALPPKSRVTIQYAGVPLGYRLSLDGADLTLQVGVHGPVGIAVTGVPQVSREYATPRSIVLQGTDGPLDVDLRIKSAQRAVLLPQLEVTALSFARIDEFPDADRILVRRVSTIRSGTLYLEDLNGRAVSLRAGEPLHFGAVRGQIRTLELREDRIGLKFRGRARGMATGWGTNTRSLMPTYLESLRERHGLYLLWGSTLYLLGILVGVLRWWGVRI